MTDERRPQDVGRRHRRAGVPSEASRLLLAEYHDAMRAELRALLDELTPAPAAPGLFGSEPAKRPALDTRARLWDLTIKLGRELGTAIDPPAAPAAGPAARTTPSRRRRVDYGET